MSLPARPIWADRFQAPTADALISALPSAVRAGVVHTRTNLRRAGLTSERVLWQGVWCWTIALHGPGAYPSGNSVNQSGCEAILVPNPARPQVCLAVAEAALTELGIANLSRSLRDVVAHAPAVCGVRWPTWEVRTREEAQALIELAILLHGRGQQSQPPDPANPAGTSQAMLSKPAKRGGEPVPVVEVVRKSGNPKAPPTTATPAASAAPSTARAAATRGVKAGKKATGKGSPAGDREGGLEGAREGGRGGRSGGKRPTRRAR